MIYFLIAGAIGGLTHCYLTHRVFPFPRFTVIQDFQLRSQQAHSPINAWDPGFLGDAFIGVVASLIVFSLGNSDVVGLRQIGIALLSGIGGDGFLYSFMQKATLQSLQRTMNNIENIQ